MIQYHNTIWGKPEILET